MFTSFFFLILIFRKRTALNQFKPVQSVFELLTLYSTLVINKLKFNSLFILLMRVLICSDQFHLRRFEILHYRDPTCTSTDISLKTSFTNHISLKVHALKIQCKNFICHFSRQSSGSICLFKVSLESYEKIREMVVAKLAFEFLLVAFTVRNQQIAYFHRFFALQGVLVDFDLSLTAHF